MLILSPRSACTARTPYTTQRSNAAGTARKGPCPRSQKRFVLLGKHIAREAGDGLGSSMGPFPYHLVHSLPGPSRLFLSPCRYVRPARTHTSHSYISLIRLTHVHVHVTRCASSTMDVASSAWLLEQGTTCPLCCRLPHLITSPRTLHMTRSYLATGADLPMVVLLYY